MRTIILTLFAVFSTVFYSGKSMELHAQMGTLSIDYEVLNTIEGYSYVSRLDVYVDGKLYGSSTEIDQRTPNSISVKIPRGNHQIKAVLLAKYEGAWEERTVENRYTYDFIWTESVNMKKKMKVKLYFDIDSGVNVNNKPKKKK